MDKVVRSRPGYFRDSSDRVKIPVNALKVGMTVVELDRPWTETPFIFQGFRIESVAQIEEIAQYCQEVLVEYKLDEWVPPTERGVLGKPPRRAKTYASHSPIKQGYATAAQVQNDARALSRDMMDDLRLGRGIDVAKVKVTVSGAVKSILDSPEAMMWLSRIRDRDAYTSEHSVNVGLLAITFGRHLGYTEEDLNRIGIGGMLHDVGKTMTPLEVLNKESALTQDEFDVMKSHTTEGRNILMAHRDVSPGAVDVAYGHHEALDGSGYPRKIKAAGISELTRIITLCDIYDAITSDRCYRKGRESFRALDEFQKDGGQKYDARLAQEFIRCIGLYPPGSIVELIGGRIGIVIGTNYRNHHLPRVMVIRDVDKQVCTEEILDLQKISGQPGREDCLIKTVIPNGSHGIRIEEYVRRGVEFL